MLEGVPVSVYSDAANIRPRLLTPGGSVTIAAAVETAITVTDALRFGYLSLMEAICTVASAREGTWTLRDALAGTTLLVLHQPVMVSVVGTRYCWAYPVPWKNAVKGAVFTIQPSAANVGTWQFHVNGFRSSL